MFYTLNYECHSELKWYSFLFPLFTIDLFIGGRFSWCPGKN